LKETGHGNGRKLEMTDIDFTIEELEELIRFQESIMDEYREEFTVAEARFTGQLIWKCKQQIKRIMRNQS
jgi:hypothetical protein